MKGVFSKLLYYSTLAGFFVGQTRILGTKWTGICMLFFGMIFLVFPSSLIRIYIPSQDVVEVGIIPLRINAAIILIYAVGTVLMFALEGAGDTRFTMFAEILITFIFYLPWVYLLGIIFHWGLVGAYLGEMIYATSHAVFMGVRLRSDLWTQIEI